MKNFVHISCNNLDEMFSTAFLFGLKNGTKRIIVSDSSIIASKFKTYLVTRKAFVENNGPYGFIFSEDMPLEVSDNTCIIVLSTGMFKTPESTNIPVLFSIYTPQKESDGYWSSQPTSYDATLPHTDCFLMNSQVRSLFLDSFRIAEKEIDIISPWVSPHVVNDEFISLLTQAVSRGVTVKILYGIGNENDERNRATEDTICLLRNIFSGSDQVQFMKGNTHIKYLICDDRFMMCGSYNLLSFRGDYTGDDVRDEGMEYVVNRSKIMQRRTQLFSW